MIGYLVCLQCSENSTEQAPLHLISVSLMAILKSNEVTKPAFFVWNMALKHVFCNEIKHLNHLKIS